MKFVPFLIFASIVFLILNTICGCSKLTDNSDNYEQLKKEIPRPLYYNISILPNSPIRGSKNAKVTIVTFADFQANKCARNANSLLELLNKHKDDVRIVYRSNPLPKHEDARRAELAARAAQNQNKFWKFHDALNDSKKLNEANLFAIASSLDLDMDKFKKDINSSQAAQIVASDRQYALETRIIDSPQNFINGRPVGPIRHAADYDSLILEEIARAKKIAKSKKQTDDKQNANNLYLQIVNGGMKKLAGTQITTRRYLNPNTRYNIPIFKDDPTQGSAKAPVTIVAFFDFECPFCERSQKALLKIKNRYKTNIRIVIKNLPLPSHSQAALAAEAAVEAQKQGLYFQYQKLLFDNREELTKPKLIELGKKAKMDTTQLSTALNSRAHSMRVERDRKLAAKLRLLDTPYFFINGKMSRGSRSVDQFSVLVRDELQAVETLLKTAALSKNSGSKNSDDVDAGVADNGDDTKAKTIYQQLTQNGATKPVFLEPGSNPTNLSLVSDNGQRVFNIPIFDYSPVYGNPNAPITIIEFGDYQCGMCATIHPKLIKLADANKDILNIVFRHYPITGHEFALLAAEAATEAHEQGNFWNYHKLLMEHQDTLTFEDLIVFADELNLDTDLMKTALETRKYRKRIKNNKKAANSIGLTGTPSVFINGRKVELSQIDNELSKIKKSLQ